MTVMLWCVMCVPVETRSAVVELGCPWKSVTVQRKLPPLKYYYDLDSGGFDLYSHLKYT